MDIRTPIGAMFVIVGALLTIFGWISDAAIYERSLGINVNLLWGSVLLLVGVVLSYYGRRATHE